MHARLARSGVTEAHIHGHGVLRQCSWALHHGLWDACAHVKLRSPVLSRPECRSEPRFLLISHCIQGLCLTRAHVCSGVRCSGALHWLSPEKEADCVKSSQRAHACSFVTYQALSVQSIAHPMQRWPVQLQQTFPGMHAEVRHTRQTRLQCSSQRHTKVLLAMSHRQAHAHVLQCGIAVGLPGAGDACGVALCPASSQALCGPAHGPCTAAAQLWRTRAASSTSAISSPMCLVGSPR